MVRDLEENVKIDLCRFKKMGMCVFFSRFRG